MVAWGEQTIPSGITALLIAMMPVWVAIFGRLFLGQRLPRLAVVGIPDPGKGDWLAIARSEQPRLLLAAPIHERAHPTVPTIGDDKASPPGEGVAIGARRRNGFGARIERCRFPVLQLAAVEPRHEPPTRVPYRWSVVVAKRYDRRSLGRPYLLARLKIKGRLIDGG